MASIDPRASSIRRPRRLSSAVAHELARMIVDGSLVVGSTLASESVLGQRFDVSRAVVREALKSLEARGLLVIRQGDGTTISSPVEWNLLDSEVLQLTIENDESDEVRRETREVRAHLEAEMVLLAAGRLGEAEFHLMRDLLHAMDVEQEPEQLHTLDNEFHDVILRCAGAPIRRSIVRHLLSESRNTAGGDAFPGRKLYVQANSEHRTIFDALTEGHAQQASLMMGEHILGGHWLERSTDADSRP